MKLCNFIVSRLLISYSLVYYKHIILHYYYLRLWVAWHDNCVEIIIQTCRWYSILNIGHIFWHRYSFRILYTKAICWEESSFTNYLLSTPYFYSLHYELTTANITMLKYNSMSDLVIPISTFFRDRWWASPSGAWCRVPVGVGGWRAVHAFLPLAYSCRSYPFWFLFYSYHQMLLVNQDQRYEIENATLPCSHFRPQAPPPPSVILLLFSMFVFIFKLFISRCEAHEDQHGTVQTTHDSLQNLRIMICDIRIILRVKHF